MPLKNYTTGRNADRSMLDIRRALKRMGVRQISESFDDNELTCALHFSLMVEGRLLPFSLPADWTAVQETLDMQGVKGKFLKEDHCYRVAWANVRDWVLAQEAIVETGMRTVAQVFLSDLLVDSKGTTLFAGLATGKLQLPGLKLLGDGK